MDPDLVADEDSEKGWAVATTTPTWSRTTRAKMPSSSTLPTLPSECPDDHGLENLFSHFGFRVTPVLKKAIESGEINLKAIVNTHQ